MADEPQVPAQPEGAGHPAKKKPAPVNLAMVEAAERGIDLSSTPSPKQSSKPAKAAEPPAPTVPPAEPAPSAPAPTPVAAAPVPAEAAPEEPAPEAPAGEDVPASSEAAAPGETEVSEVPAEALAQLADTASRKRLSPSDEDKATALLRGCLTTGETAAALAAMPKLPWILGVRAIEQAWPQLSPEGKTQLLEQLATLQSEHAIRLRLSVARSLAKIDPPVGVELAGAVCRAIWDSEKGALSTDHSKLIGNVFIGRGKPWVIQLGLDGLPPEDAQAIVAAVVFSAFNVNNPPITQLSILRYAGARLGELHPNLLAMIARGVGRWSGKWQDSLRKEVQNLPEAISAGMKTPRGGKPEPAENEKPAGEAAEGANGGDHEEGEIPLPPALEEKLKLAVESGDAESVEAVTLEVNAWRDAQAVAQREAAEKPQKSSEPSEEPERRGDKKRRGRDRDRDRNERPAERRERPVYVSREQEAAAKSGGGAFNLSSVLKQIESQFSQLRGELASTQAKLRKAEAAPARKPVDRVVLSVEEANLSPDELKRLVLQLERRNNELQTRVEELLADSETRALATAADADITVQFRTLLKLKLQEDYSDYLALEKNLPEFVVQQHYRALIRHVFGVLRDEGVSLEGDLPPPPPEPLPPPPPPPIIEDEEEDEDSALDELDAEPDSEAAEAEAPESDTSDADSEADEGESEEGEPTDALNGDIEESGEASAGPADDEPESKHNGDHGSEEPASPLDSASDEDRDRGEEKPEPKSPER
jgi:hypothetical protein